MNPREFIGGEKQTTLFGGRGLEKTLNWLDDNFTGYLEIKEPSDEEKRYFLFLINKEIQETTLYDGNRLFFGQEIYERVKKLLENDEVVIEAFYSNKDKINSFFSEFDLGEIECFQIKDIEFPSGRFFTRIEDLSDLRNVSNEFDIDGLGVSEEKNSVIVLNQGEVFGGVYSDKFGTLKRENSIVDIKQSFPLNLFIANKEEVIDASQTIQFKDSEEFWESAEFPSKDLTKKRDIGKLVLIVKEKEGREVLEDATIDVRKEGKKVSLGRTTKRGRFEKKLLLGNYTIWVKREGYKPKGRDIELDEEVKEETILLEKTEKISTKLQFLTKDKKPVQESNVKLKRAIDLEFEDQTNESGVVSFDLPYGIYQLILNKDGIQMRERIELSEEDVGTEKTIRVMLPLTYKELLKLVYSVKQEDLILEKKENDVKTFSRLKKGILGKMGK